MRCLAGYASSLPRIMTLTSIIMVFGMYGIIRHPMGSLPIGISHRTELFNQSPSYDETTALMKLSPLLRLGSGARSVVHGRVPSSFNHGASQQNPASTTTFLHDPGGIG